MKMAVLFDGRAFASKARAVCLRGTGTSAPIAIPAATTPTTSPPHPPEQQQQQQLIEGTQISH
jgi:hypothetical protein